LKALAEALVSALVDSVARWCHLELERGSARTTPAIQDLKREGPECTTLVYAKLISFSGSTMVRNSQRIARRIKKA